MQVTVGSILYTAWCHIMAQTSKWHKTEVGIFIIILKLVHFHIPNKEVEVTTVTSVLSVCKFCQVRALVSCRNYHYSPLKMIAKGLFFHFMVSYMET